MLREREGGRRRERNLVKSFINDPIQVDHPMSRNGIQILGRIKNSPLNPVTQAGHNATAYLRLYLSLITIERAYVRVRVGAV